MDDEKPPRNDLSYKEAMHGVQSAIAYRIGRGEDLATSKHLRVGVDSAMVTDAALARLLIKKGVFTAEEYAEEIRLEANRELDRAEDQARAEMGRAEISFR